MVGDSAEAKLCLDRSKAALYIYRQISRDHGPHLLGEVITEREILKMRLEAPDPNVHDIETHWRGRMDNDCT